MKAALVVRQLRPLSPAAFVLRFDRAGMRFQPGQHLRLGLPGRIDRREYSIYSPIDAPYLEVLVREVEGGLVSGQLRRLRAGDAVAVEGPFGAFTLPGGGGADPLFFVATGTGVSPFRCFALSHPSLDYRLLHGVRTPGEFYGHEAFDGRRLVRCVSRAPGGDFPGRVTDCLRSQDTPRDALYYLCGGCDMVYEVFGILRDRGVEPERIRTEVYF